VEVWQDKIKGDWCYKFEYEGTVYIEREFKSQLDARSTGTLKEMQVIMGKEFIPEPPESKKKALFEPDNSIKKRPEKKQNPEKVTSKVTPKVTPNNKPETDSRQSFTEDGNLESNSQNNIESNSQKEEFILNEGWIPLFRKLLDSQVFQSEGLLKVWIWCLLKVTYKARWVPVRINKATTEVHLFAGQFIFGRKTAAKELKMKPSTAWKRMQKLENMQNLNIQSNRHYSVVTLANWKFYQGLLKKVTQKVTAREQPGNTNKKGKKGENNIHAQNFISFWKAYPNRKAKKKAHEAWQKLDKDEDMETLLPTLLDTIEKQKQAKEIQKAKGEFVSEWPYPATWLNGRRWEDEIEIKKRWDHATG